MQNIYFFIKKEMQIPKMQKQNDENAKKATKMQMLLQGCIFEKNAFSECFLYLWAALEPML